MYAEPEPVTDQTIIEAEPGQPLVTATTINKQLQFLSTVGSNLCNFLISMFNANIGVILAIKKAFFTFLFKAIAYISYFIANNQDFVVMKIDLTAAILKTIVLNMPYLNVPVVAQPVVVEGFPAPEATTQSWLSQFSLLTRLLGVPQQAN